MQEKKIIKEGRGAHRHGGLPLTNAHANRHTFGTPFSFPSHIVAAHKCTTTRMCSQKGMWYLATQLKSFPAHQKVSRVPLWTSRERVVYGMREHALAGHASVLRYLSNPHLRYMHQGANCLASTHTHTHTPSTHAHAWDCFSFVFLILNDFLPSLEPLLTINLAALPPPPSPACSPHCRRRLRTFVGPVPHC